jgi:dipeptidase
MCDTFVALGNSTESGSVLLAKSADTEVNEAEHVVRFAPRDYEDGAKVRVTHLAIPQARRTHEIILGKSFWSWGAELGANEHGVAVGNEAAFSNQLAQKEGVVCLDLLRLAVERAATAREAVDVIGRHVEDFGQGGNCQMMGNYWFDSGLLVADTREAYMVNCAGHHWAARRVDDIQAMSNRYQITDDWLVSSLDGGNGARPDFRALFADEARERETASLQRECRAIELLQARKGAINVRDMADILRDVGEDAEAYDIPADDLPSRICMHAGPQEARFWHATGALISDSSDEGIVVWMTATSATDLSIFKPLFFKARMPDMGPAPTERYDPSCLWWKHERLHRRIVANYKALKPELRADFDSLEDEFFAEAPKVRSSSVKVQSEFVEDSWRRAAEVTDRWIERLEKQNYYISEPRYREMWARFNAEASFPG